MTNSSRGLRLFNLPISVPLQEKTRWCWASIGVAVAHYYGDLQWQQCLVANAVLQESACCASVPLFVPHHPCNVPRGLDESLAAVGHFRLHLGTPTSFASIRNSLQQGHPVGIRVIWGASSDVDGYNSHYVLIVGCDDSTGEQTINISDPWIGDIDNFLFDDLTTSYQGVGRWADCYWVR